MISVPNGWKPSLNRCCFFTPIGNVSDKAQSSFSAKHFWIALLVSQSYLLHTFSSSAKCHAVWSLKMLCSLALWFSEVTRPFSVLRSRILLLKVWWCYVNEDVSSYSFCMTWQLLNLFRCLWTQRQKKGYWYHVVINGRVHGLLLWGMVCTSALFRLYLHHQCWIAQRIMSGLFFKAVFKDDIT